MTIEAPHGTAHQVVRRTTREAGDIIGSSVPTRPAAAAGREGAGATAAGPGPPRLYRRAEGRVVAGVAAGIAEHLGVPVIVTRLIFLGLTVIGGLGALLYAAYWAVVPPDPAGEQTRTSRDTAQLVAFGCLAIGIQLIALLAGFGGLQSAIGWLVALIAVGAGTIWHQTDPRRRQRWSAVLPGAPALADYLSSRYGVRLAAGAVLVLVGVVGMVVVLTPLSEASLASLLNGLAFTVITIGGVAVVFGPLLWGMVSQLRSEREARIVERERAEVAALVHDQVLHTLALIQRNAGDESEVSRLARGQERRLRNWLYRPGGSPAERFGAALEEAAGEVESEFPVSIDSVVVGDRAVDSRVAALVAAVREAMVNAAKHSGARMVSLYAEVEPERISAYVRDRGRGFDLATVAGDRHGVQGSIIGRMRRHGGQAEVRTAPGEGTEVRLVLPAEGSAGD